MNVDLFTATGTKKGTLALPDSLFAAPVRQGLMHQAVVMQQSNRRNTVAHAKSRGEVAGSSAKLYAQKHTGRARRGSIRSPLLRGGGKAFGPRKNANFIKDMPRSMRRAALLSCLSFRAKNGAIIGLESYPDTIKTKDAHQLLAKLPVELGRRILIVMPGMEKGLALSMRNIPRVITLPAAYLNPEDVLNARHIVFMADAVKKAEELWGEPKKHVRKEMKKRNEKTERSDKKAVSKKTVKKVGKKKSSPTSPTSNS